MRDKQAQNSTVKGSLPTMTDFLYTIFLSFGLHAMDYNLSIITPLCNLIFVITFPSIAGGTKIHYYTVIEPQCKMEHLVTQTSDFTGFLSLYRHVAGIRSTTASHTKYSKARQSCWRVACSIMEVWGVTMKSRKVRGWTMNELESPCSSVFTPSLYLCPAPFH